MRLGDQAIESMQALNALLQHASRASGCPRTFRIEDLPDIDHGVFNQPLSIDKGHGVDTPASDALLLGNLFQYATHAGQLPGLPILHKESIPGAIDDARALLPNHKSAPYVVPPKMHRGMRRRIRNGVYELEAWRSLPPIGAFGRFTATGRCRTATSVWRSQEMSVPVLSELRLMASAQFDSQPLLCVVLAGDARLPEKLRCAELIALVTRWGAASAPVWPPRRPHLRSCWPAWTSC